MKKKKEEERLKSTAQATQAILTDSGMGEPVPLVTSVSSGREISDIYLKHPANESSDDSEGEEETKNENIDGNYTYD